MRLPFRSSSTARNITVARKSRQGWRTPWRRGACPWRPAMHTKRKLRLLLICGAVALEAQPAYVIQDAKVYTVSGPVLERASIVIQDGKIREVGLKVTVPAGAVRIDVRGLTVYPGLFDSNSYLGLSVTPREVEFGQLMPEFLGAT